MKFEPGHIFYTKAGHYTELIKIRDDEEYPLLCECDVHGEVILDTWMLDGTYQKGKKSTMDLEIE